MSPEASETTKRNPERTPDRKKISFEKQKSAAIQEACDDQREAFKAVLEARLVEWVDIWENPDYEKFVSLTGKYQVWPDLRNVRFSDINNGVGIVIKKEGDAFKAYNLNNPKLFGNLHAEIGTFKNGGFEKLNPVISLFSPNYNRTKEHPVPQEDAATCEVAETPAQIAGKPRSAAPIAETLKATPETGTPYLIKKWDSLWKIVKKNYRLSDSDEDAHSVWKIIEKLRKDPKNRGVIKDETGKIFIWETLHLPKTIKMKHDWVAKTIVLYESPLPSKQKRGTVDK